MAAEGNAESIGPQRLSDIIGQTEAVQRLAALVDLSKRRGEALPHILFIGREGVGKRTLAVSLANEMGAAIVATSGTAMQRAARSLARQERARCCAQRAGLLLYTP